MVSHVLTFVEESTIIGYQTDSDTFTVEQGQGILQTATLATVRLPYYTLRLLHGGAFVSVKHNTIQIAAITTPVHIQDATGAWFILPIGSQWKTSEQQLELQLNGILADTSALTPLPSHYLQEKRLLLSKPLQSPINSVVATVFDGKDLPAIRAALPAAKSGLTTSEWLTSLVQLLPIVEKPKQIIIVEELIQYEHLQPLVALHPMVQDIVWAYNLLPNASTAILLQVPFAYLQANLPAIALEHWYTQLSGLYEFDRFSDGQAHFLHVATDSLRQDLIALHPARTRLLASYWQRLFTEYPSANTTNTVTELQSLFTTQLPQLPVVQSVQVAEVVTLNAVTLAESQVAIQEAEQLLRQAPVMFTSTTNLKAVTATAVQVQNAIIGGATTDFPINFTIHTQKESVSAIAVHGKTYPNELGIQAFVQWVTGL